MAGRVSINRVKRRFLHAVWPRLIGGPVGGVKTDLDYLLRTERAALTPGEQAVIEKNLKKLEEVSEDMYKIYYRLKR